MILEAPFLGASQAFGHCTHILPRISWKCVLNLIINCFGQGFLVGLEEAELSLYFTGGCLPFGLKNPLGTAPELDPVSGASLAAGGHPH